jgi:hypothetical protein
MTHKFFRYPEWQTWVHRESSWIRSNPGTRSDTKLFRKEPRAQPALGLLWFSTALGHGGFQSKTRQNPKLPRALFSAATFSKRGQTHNAWPFLQSGKELPQSKGASRDSRSEPFPWDDVWSDFFTRLVGNDRDKLAHSKNPDAHLSETNKNRAAPPGTARLCNPQNN